MPFYEYECKSCGHTLEAMQKINDDPLKKCPHCGKSQLQRLMSAPVFRLKGGGWYETDFKGDQDNKKNLADRPEADAAKDDKKAGDAKSTDVTAKDGGKEPAAKETGSKDSGAKDSAAKSDKADKPAKAPAVESKKAATPPMSKRGATAATPAKRAKAPVRSKAAKPAKAASKSKRR